MATKTPPLSHRPTLLSPFLPKHLPSLSSPHKPFPFSSSKPPFSLSLSSLRASLPRVSTAAPLSHSPPHSDFPSELARLKSLNSKLSASKTLIEKTRVLDRDPRVKRFFKTRASGVFDSLNLDKFEFFLLKCVVAAGQEHVLGEFPVAVESERSGLRTALYNLAEMVEKFDGGSERVRGGFNGEDIRALRVLLETLGEMEQFYNCIGGIIGYQAMVLELLEKSMTYGGEISNLSHQINGRLTESQLLEIHPPKVLDLSEDTEYASEAALWGLEGLPDLGEIYPLGGSADRLGLVDAETGECLPAAMLPFCGRTLLEGLIRDLQAREFLYFKLHGKQCITPVAIMTSSAKNNHERITSLCETHSWFGRGRSRFRLFEQPLVPAVSAEDGKWLVMRQFMPVCKPGGHGAIWKLAFDKGIFKWFYDHQRKGATVRQVSNVVAATDLTLLALAGIGLRHRKKLGFASCKRNSGATEGINCLVEKKDHDGMWRYGLSCIEYTEFDKFGISEGRLSPNILQDEFPANTNIMFVDLPSAELIGSSNNKTSLPGMVLNTKKTIKFADQFGIQHSVAGGRLECTMQNIADNFFSTFSSPCSEDVEDLLDTFIVYNVRRKVTSSAKKKRKHSDISLHQTPDGALLDIQRNAYDILSKCDIVIPSMEGNDKYVDSGPPFLIFLHPALGPLWEVTRQKFHGGSIAEGSELQVEVSEFLWGDVRLDGSMIIVAENILGTVKIDESGESILDYGQRCGRCKLQNVEVHNEGIDRILAENTYWKHDVHRHESFKVVLHGNAEFEATDVVIKGNHIFEVPNGYKLKVTSGNSGLLVECNPIEEQLMNSGSWFWNYKINGAHVQLELVEQENS